MNNNFKFFLCNLCALMVLNLHTNSHGTESEDLPIGIENPAQNCFANSSLQLLASIPNYHIKTTNLILTEEEGIQFLREAVGFDKKDTQEDPCEFITKLFEGIPVFGEQHYFNGNHAKLSYKNNSHNPNPWFFNIKPNDSVATTSQKELNSIPSAYLIRKDIIKFGNNTVFKEQNVSPFELSFVGTTGVPYNLVSVIYHCGNAQEGHYIALVKRGDKWYYANDALIGNAQWTKAGPVIQCYKDGDFVPLKDVNGGAEPYIAAYI